ncbi:MULTISPECIES: DUF1801 domain-containing protein [unclassified Rhizobium]|uniref:DUF1801 domain-containing protein n=1 Tax=unclassified Rhizobium TaxID=2613769 RepID=UPI002479ED39|nr:MULTISPECIES: DUF1801 domain-containing protein [unclassified Rhizobium]MDH7803902.1 hypothetical protein [Rhizobium sp. AN70]
MRDHYAKPPMSNVVSAAFEAFSEPTRSQLLRIRCLIFEVAEETPGVGPLMEALKWGEPAYLTAATHSGSTIRLGVLKSQADTAAILFNCQTSLVETFRTQFPDAFAYHGNRAILLPPSAPLPEPALSICLAMALTYHHRTLLTINRPGKA